MKLTCIALFGAGYVLGSKAGRQRYEQLVGLAQQFADGIGREGTTREQIRDYVNGSQTSWEAPPASAGSVRSRVSSAFLSGW